MWIFYALTTAIIWGLYYALSEKTLKNTNTSSLLLFISLCTSMVYGSAIAVREKFIWEPTMPVLFFLALLANYCSYKAITLHSSAACAMLEISYPVWCYLFCYLLFDKIHWNIYTIVGAIMIASGTLIFLVGEK